MILALTLIVSILTVTPSFAGKPKVIASKGNPVLKQKSDNTWLVKTGKKSSLKIILQNKTIINIGNDSLLVLKNNFPMFKQGSFEVSSGRLKVSIGSANFILKQGFNKFKISASTKLPANVRKKMLVKMVQKGKQAGSEVATSKKNPAVIHGKFKFKSSRLCLISGQMVLDQEKSCLELKEGKCNKQLLASYCYQNKYHFPRNKKQKSGFLQVALPVFLYPQVELDINSFLPASVRSSKSKGEGASKGDEVSASGAGGSMCLNSSSSSSASDVNDSNQTSVKPTPTTKLIIKIDLPQMVQE
ncbi:MAG: hypothetical protein PF689_01010 [Deltaproteobacteria bacterium]|jgi:hypothetical protein|nr:hypothetical protein [Deltaproteobacteria bacterium]